MSLLKTDKKHLWHPFTQQKTARPPLLIEKAEGAYLYTGEGKKVIDAISSWWVILHGHCEPTIAKAVSEQLQIMEQVIFAGMTHPKAVKLVERLLPLLPGEMNRGFFSDNGSTSVEVGLKMAIQRSWNLGERKSRVVAFRFHIL